jgi:hypothetical protein
MRLSDDTKAERLLSDANDSANARALAGVASRIRADGYREMEALQPALVLPQQVLDLALILYPDLSSPDRPTKVRAWREFMNSDVCAPYRVHPNPLRRL